MIIQTENRKIIKDSEDRQFVNCDIDSSSTIIFDILSKKLYSDPIGSIVREYVSNGIDANREADREDLPVEVKITESNPLLGNVMTFSVIDYGVGISTDRMWNVFAKYTGSTKRDTNTQIGGFGLGSKVFFAYRDSFFVHTWVDGIEYLYKVYKDQSNKPSIELVWEDYYDINSRTNGTEIIGLITNTSDRRNFIQACNDQLAFVPNINSIGFTIDKPKILEETDDYIITEQYDLTSILIGNIRYRVRFSEIASNYRSDGNVIPKFNIGDIQVTASRESIEFDSKGENVKKIRNKLEAIKLKFELDSKPYLDSLTEEFILDYYLNSNDKKFSDIKVRSNSLFSLESLFKERFNSYYRLVNKASDLVNDIPYNFKSDLVEGKKNVYLVKVPDSFTTTKNEKARLFKDYLDKPDRSVLIYKANPTTYLYNQLSSIYEFKKIRNRNLLKVVKNLKESIEAFSKIVEIKGLNIILTEYKEVTDTQEFKDYYKNSVKQFSQSISTPNDIINYCLGSDAYKGWDESTTNINTFDSDIKLYSVLSHKDCRKYFIGLLYSFNSNFYTSFIKKYKITCKSSNCYKIPIIYKKQVEDYKALGFISIEDFIKDNFIKEYFEYRCNQIINSKLYNIYNDYILDVKDIDKSRFNDFKLKFVNKKSLFDFNSDFRAYFEEQHPITDTEIEKYLNDNYSYTLKRLLVFERQLDKEAKEYKYEKTISSFFSLTDYEKIKNELPKEIQDLLNKFIELNDKKIKV